MPQKVTRRTISYLQIAPVAATLLLFFGAPLLVVVAVSFWTNDVEGISPAFDTQNYVDLFTSRLTLQLYLNTVGYAVTVALITLVVGFLVSYFLVFHIRSLTLKFGLFLLCTVPFWTSDIIRMISWIPLFGVTGVINQALLALGIIKQPIRALLFSNFSVIVAYVHLYTLFMVVTLFNSMSRISPSLFEAARDAGAGGWRILTEVVIPLSRSGIVLGLIFVITLVMSDFFVINVMSGGRTASVVSAMSNQIALLQYPSAAASAVVLVTFVMLMVAVLLRMVDVRRELTT